MISAPGWLECQECGHIFRGLVLVICVDEIVAEGSEEAIPQLPPQACSACGSTTNNDWSIPDSLDDWLLTVDETVASSDGDRDRIGAVFVAAACEAMLREIIEFGLQKQNVPPKLILYLFGGGRVDGPKKLRELYNAVATTRIYDLLKEAGLLRWYEAWDRLVKARNKYAHGEQTSEDLGDAIHIVARHMDEAFVTLRNAVLVPKSTTESIGASAGPPTPPSGSTSPAPRGQGSGARRCGGG
jgi:hypothetical protein